MSSCGPRIFRFDPGSSTKLLSAKTKKNVSPKYGAILPRQGVPSPVPIKNVSINAAVPASPYKDLLQQQRNVLVNISHSSCTCNGNHVGLLIKTGNIENERMMTQTTICNF